MLRSQVRCAVEEVRAEKMARQALEQELLNAKNSIAALKKDRGTLKTRLKHKVRPPAHCLQLTNVLYSPLIRRRKWCVRGTAC